MIDRMLNSRKPGRLRRRRARALTGWLTAQRYVVPFWHNPVSRVAHNAELRFPETIPIYGDWIGWQPDVWWVEE